MIIWINGSFGVGKTQLAFELHSRLSGSFVFDPEEIGFVIGNLTPPARRLSDFQDYPLWRQMTGKTLLHASKGQKYLIVPMTLVNPTYFDEVTHFLRGNNVLIKHVALTASKEALLKRLSKRGDGADSWGTKQIELCLERLSQLEHAEHLDTEKLSISDVAEQVAERFGLDLSPPKGFVQNYFQRLAVQLKHIRWKL